MAIETSINKRSKIIIVSIFAALLMIAFAAYFQKAEYARFKQQKQAELKTITDFKSTQIADWLRERLADAKHFSSSPLYTDAILAIIQKPNDTQNNKIADRNEMIRQLRGYSDVHIVANHKRLSMSTSKVFNEVPAALFPLIDSCIWYNQIIFSDFLTNTQNGTNYIASIAPITDSKGQIFATVIFYINPDTHINPILQFSPKGLADLETCILDKSFFHSLLDSLAEPLPEYLLAVTGQTGFYNGRFTHDKKVLAYTCTVHNSPWHIVSQIQTSKLRREFIVANIPVAVAIIVLVFLIVLFISWIFQRSENATTKKLMRQEQQTMAFLKVSEAKFRAVIENSNDAILFLNLNGTITYCAPAVGKILGFNAEQLINQHFSKLVCDRSIFNFDKEFDKFKSSNETMTKCCELKHVAQKTRWVEITFNNQTATEFLNVIIVIIRDIQHRKEQEMEIERLIEFQSTILENVGMAIITTDIQGTITSFNKTAVELLGYKADEVIGKITPEKIHLQSEIEEQAKFLTEKLKLKIDPGFEVFTIEAKLGNPQHYQWNYIRKDGTLFPVNLIVTSLKDKNGEIIGYVGIAMDMTSIKNAEEKFSYFYNLSPDIAGISRLSDGLLLDVNTAFLNTLGYSYYDVIGKTAIDIDMWAETFDRDIFINALANNAVVKNFENRIKTKNGKILTVLYSASKFLFGGDECILFVIRDISEIRQKESDLLNERMLTNSLFDSSPGITVVFNNNFELIRWNAKTVAELGYSADELAKKPLYSFLSDKSTQAANEAISTVNKDGYASTELVILHQSGEKRNYFFSLAKTTIDSSIYFVAYGIDITERKRENEALQQVEQRFANIFNLSPNVIGITSLSTGKIMTANAATLELTGYTEEEIFGKTTLELRWWENPSDREKIISILKEAGEVRNYEMIMRRRNGELLTCLFNARPLFYNNEQCLLFVVIDISERKKAEELLRINQDRLHKAQEIGHLGYSEHIIGGSDVWISAEGKRLFGLDPEDGYVNIDIIVKSIDNVEPLAIATAQLIETGEHFDQEYLIHPADGGTDRYIHAVQNIEKDDNTQQIKVITTFKDVTQSKKIELEIRQLNENLEKMVEERTAQLAIANKDLEAFAYSVSHDLRAPIRHIDGFFKLLYGQIPQPTATMESYAQRINTASQRMSTMIDDLLSFSRLGRKEITSSNVDVNPIVKEIVDYYKSEFPQRQIDWSIETLPIVYGDKNLLKTVFENLIGNAIKYTRPKEIAIIEVGAGEPSGTNVKIYVKDNGVGFDMAYQKKLFGVFQRLHSADEFEGTGIGLANVKQIVSRHGGQITAWGEVGVGACFTIELPSAQNLQ